VKLLLPGMQDKVQVHLLVKERLGEGPWDELAVLLSQPEDVEWIVPERYALSQCFYRVELSW